MSNYENGIQTRERIIKVCKELFYDKGYERTTYDNICKKGGINRGLIPYHFKGKSAIASVIYLRFMSDNKKIVYNAMKANFKGYDLQIGTAVELRNQLNTIFDDEKLARFYYQLCKETIVLNDNSSVLADFNRAHVKEYHLPFTENDIRLMTASMTGMSLSTTIKYVEGNLDIPLKELIDYRIRFFYRLMKIKEGRIEEIVKQSQDIYSKLNIGCKNYFKFFERE